MKIKRKEKPSLSNLEGHGGDGTPIIGENGEKYISVVCIIG